jgi:hypothetical protein
MNRRIVFWVSGALLLGLAGVAVATFEPFEQKGSVFIVSDHPITEDQVQKMQSEGYSNLQIVRQGRYFLASGSKDGMTSTIAVDSFTGRLRGDDDDD